MCAHLAAVSAGHLVAGHAPNAPPACPLNPQGPPGLLLAGLAATTLPEPRQKSSAGAFLPLLTLSRDSMDEGEARAGAVVVPWARPLCMPVCRACRASGAGGMLRPPSVLSTQAGLAACMSGCVPGPRDPRSTPLPCGAFPPS